MTPQEIAAYVKAKFTLPKGAGVAIKSNGVLVGNADICFVLHAGHMANEDHIDLVVKGSLPSLEGAMKEVATQKLNAVKAEEHIKQLHINSKKRKPSIIKK